MAELNSLTPVQSLSRDQFLSMCGVAFDDAMHFAPPDSPEEVGDFVDALAIEVRERLFACAGCGGGHFLRGVNHVG